MAAVNIMDVRVLDNPAPFDSQMQFEVTFECLAELSDGMYRDGNQRVARLICVRLVVLSANMPWFADLEWKVTYVGSATSPAHDQELDSVLVGPVPLGISKFRLSVRAR
jgi:histone chaperone ASF1